MWRSGFGLWQECGDSVSLGSPNFNQIMGNLCCCFDGPTTTAAMPPPATTTVTRSTYEAPGAPQNFTYGAQPVEEVKPAVMPQPAQPHQIVMPDGRVAVLGSDGQYYPVAQNQQSVASVSTVQTAPQPPVVQNQVVETHTTTVVEHSAPAAPAAPQPEVGLGTAMLAGTAGFLGGMMLGSAMEQPSTTVVVEESPVVIEESPTIIEETVVIDDDDDW
ncbi:hypothetical protein FOZ61_004162 [Perkinsus olseni]|uniref:Uncharacterized protein n=1 Tax=Perkinsus olseni TaxID=32597 RepID=A0A7J6LLR8_PEROL|nr:hypothetical protein FOZ61_004162 [Perkinsus olseni]